MHMPRNGFDSLAAVARMNDDNTTHHRERWPSLAWVWDELDMLRRWQDEAIDHDDHTALQDECDELAAAVEQRDALSKAVMLLLRDDPDMDQVQAVLSGAWT